MSPCYVLERHPSYLAARIRQHANRVTETGQMAVRIERSSTPSGYKISFDKPSTQIPLFTGLASFTELEKEAFKALRKNGVWDNVARALVVEKRNAFGKDGARYIVYAIRYFRKHIVKAGKLRVPAEKLGGVLAKAIKLDWYYPHFYEQKATEERRLWREEHLRYPEPTGQRGDDRDSSRLPREDEAAPRRGGTRTKPLEEYTSRLSRFAQDYPDTYERIVAAVTPRYASPPAGLALSRANLETMKAEAIRTFCLQCLTEFDRGNVSFFPLNLLS